MKLDSGHSVEYLPQDEAAKQKRLFKGYTQPLIRLQPGDCLLCEDFKIWANKIYNFQLKQIDVMIVTFPKCGTTWMQEIVWTMRNNPDLDSSQADAPVMWRSPFIEMDMLLRSENLQPMTPDSPYIKAFLEMFPGVNLEEGMMFQATEMSPDPRTIKTHLPLSLMPKNMLETSKVIYVAREPKDCCISYAHHSRLLKGHDFVGTTDEFVELFVNKGLFWGSYADHFNEAWKYKNHPNMHIVFYEDLKSNTFKEMKTLDKFLGTNLTTEQLKKIMHYASFSEMKKRDNAIGEVDGFMNTEIMEKDGGFYRKGQSKCWKESLSVQQQQKINSWIKGNFEDAQVVERFIADK